jgi:hypothetical protein
MQTSVYLFNPQGDDRLLRRSVLPRWLRGVEKTLLVVPRALCIHEQIDCSHLPLWKAWLWRQVAQVQARIRSPFVKTGYCGLRQGKRIHLWIWDMQFELDFALRHPNALPTKVMPSCLLAPGMRAGVGLQTADTTDGYEASLWADGLLQDTMYVPFRSISAWDVRSWAVHASERNENLGVKWPLTWQPGEADVVLQAGLMNSATKTWPGLLSTEKHRVDWRVALARWRKGVLLAASLGVAAYLGAGASEQYTLNSKLARAQAQKDQKILSMENASQQQRSAQIVLDWLDQVTPLQPKIPMGEYVAKLSDRVQRLDLAVRELEITGQTASAVLVPLGSQFRITAVIQAIEQEPLFYDARFVDVVGGDSFKFSWRLRAELPKEPASTEGVRRP